MKLNSFKLAGLLALMSAGSVLAQPATTAKTFRMYNDATHSVSITAGTTAGTGTFVWPQPSAGFLKSGAPTGDVSNISIGAVDLSTSDVTGILTINRGGTGLATFGPAGSIAYSAGPSNPLGFSAVGTLGQLLVSGATGAPTWTSSFPSGMSVPFNQISTGTNTSAVMTVGAGASLAPAAGGTVTANQFVGAGSTSNAVDLGTTEVNGTLPVTNGGTGSTAVGGNGQVAYSTGSQYGFTTGGTTGQVLTYNNAGAPSWTSVMTAKDAGRIQGNGTNYSYVVTPAPASGYGIASVVVTSVESAVSQTATITAKTATTFTVSCANILSNTEYINWVAY